jgi:hypothetical protein
MRGCRALTAVLLAITTGCTAATPPASATAPAARAQPEADAWAEVRSALPAVPLIVPTWLPASLDRTRVEVRGIGHGPDPADPVYRVAYVAPGGATLLFALGPASDVAGSAIGTRVRNSPAVLSFATSLWSDPTKPAPRQVRWQEDRYVLRIETTQFTGEDLLHIAWSLDRSGAPAPMNPYTRVKPGVCAASSTAPEETVKRLVSFVGTGDRDAVMDCFSLELLGAQPGYGAWADLPRASDLNLRPAAPLAGRVVVGAGWSFASDPGGAWGRQASAFFTLGLEDGRWRVYETGSAAYASPP